MYQQALPHFHDCFGKELSKPYEMIDMVTTPDGSLVAMVHCNNCTSDLNAWINLFKEYQELLGIPVDMNELYGNFTIMRSQAMQIAVVLFRIIIFQVNP